MSEKILLGTGALSLVLFKKTEKEFIDSIPDIIKINLFPKLSKEEIELELIKLYKKHGSNRQDTKSDIGVKRKSSANNKLRNKK